MMIDIEIVEVIKIEDHQEEMIIRINQEDKEDPIENESIYDIDTIKIILVINFYLVWNLIYIIGIFVKSFMKVKLGWQ